MLRDAQDVSGWVFEPRDLVTCGRRPYPKLAILNEGIFLKGDSPFLEPGDNLLNVLDFPTEDGALGGSEILNFGNSNHVSTGSHHQGILIDANKLKPQFALEKSSRFIVVFGEKEAHYFP